MGESESAVESRQRPLHGSYRTPTAVQLQPHFNILIAVADSVVCVVAGSQLWSGIAGAPR